MEYGGSKLYDKFHVAPLSWQPSATWVYSFSTESKYKGSKFLDKYEKLINFDAAPTCTWNKSLAITLQSFIFHIVMISYQWCEFFQVHNFMPLHCILSSTFYSRLDLRIVLFVSCSALQLSHETFKRII